AAADCRSCPPSSSRGALRAASSPRSRGACLRNGNAARARRVEPGFLRAETDGSRAGKARAMRPVPLRLAVVGCGAVTERYHLPAIAASSDVAVAAFVDPVVGRARSFASRWSGGRALSDYREVADLADLAIVAAPNHWHEPIAVDLLRRGIHVLVEKPMARTRAECDRMIDAAAEGGAVLAV